MSKLIQLPNNMWVRAHRITKIRAYTGGEDKFFRVFESDGCWTDFESDNPDEDATKLACLVNGEEKEISSPPIDNAPF